MEYTKEQIEEMKNKADRWDALAAKIEKCYCDDDDLCTIGEITALCFGWL